MSSKKTDLYKNLRMKVQGQMHKAPVPDRFAGQGEALVPFSAKLPKVLVKQLQTQALIKGVPTGELVAVLLRSALGDVPLPVAEAASAQALAAKPVAKKAVAKKAVANKAAPSPAPAVKKAAAKKAAAQKPVVKNAPQAQTAAKKTSARKASK